MDLLAYDDGLKLKDALELYFSKYHFKNGGYDLKWFKIKIGPVFIPLPNIKNRVDAVKIHDIHHIITGYPATIKGEAEIGAWEIASGCGRYYVAWLLNAGSFFYGLFLCPAAIFHSFRAGRSAKINIYYNTVYNDVLLDKTVGELRRRVDMHLQPAKLSDYLLFILYSLVVVLYHIAVLCIVIALFFGLKLAVTKLI